MNIPALHPVARYFPYVALAARYRQDKGDHDADLQDYIEDTLRQWHHQPIISRIPTSIDFTYMVETGGEIIVAALGTEGGDAWKSNTLNSYRPEYYRKIGMHPGFATAGEELADRIIPLIRGVGKFVTLVGHSRGSPRSLRAQEIIYDKMHIKAEHIGFNGPPLYAPWRVKRYNNLGLHSYRVINSRDLVDNMGECAYKHHKSEFIKLPFVRNRLNSIPLIGWLFGGHAYSSDIEGMIAYFTQKGMHDEVQYLSEKRSVCTI